MRLVDKAYCRLAEPKFVAELSRLDDRALEIRSLERIAEARFEIVEHLSARMKWHRLPGGLGRRSQLVDPVAMVAMRVGDDGAFEHAHFGREQLLAQVWPAIDEHSLARALDQDR